MPTGKGYFWPFRLLVAAIFGLAVLLIIISTINYFNTIHLRESEERLMEGLRSAINAPTTPDKLENGLVLKKDLSFVRGVYSVKPFSNRFNMPVDCIKFQSYRTNFEVIDEKRMNVKYDAKADVYFQCVYQSS
ncbi:MAG: hypothetical protein DRO07_02145, partial [Candidatus Iainarchaeum archaeon]